MQLLLNGCMNIEHYRVHAEPELSLHDIVIGCQQRYSTGSKYWDSSNIGKSPTSHYQKVTSKTHLVHTKMLLINSFLIKFTKLIFSSYLKYYFTESSILGATIMNIILKLHFRDHNIGPFKGPKFHVVTI